MSQLNISPVFDVHADVQGRDLNSAATAIDRVIAANQPAASESISVILSGQVETMSGELFRTIRGHGVGGGAGLSAAGDQFPELDSIR